MVRRLILILPALTMIGANAQRGRYMPPPAVECNRNNLTSYTGEVTGYSRKDGKILLTLKTDADTVETVSLRPGDKILLNAKPMNEKDWTQVEEKEGKLKAGMRATTWICRGGRPVLDWQPLPD
jgi:hypothetical protein